MQLWRVKVEDRYTYEATGRAATDRGDAEGNAEDAASRAWSDLATPDDHYNDVRGLYYDDYRKGDVDTDNVDSTDAFDITVYQAVAKLPVTYRVDLYVKANTKDEARKLAQDLIDNDWPEVDDYGDFDSIYQDEVEIVSVNECGDEDTDEWINKEDGEDEDGKEEKQEQQSQAAAVEIDDIPRY